MDTETSSQFGEADRFRHVHCISCHRPRPHERWAPGLDAVLPGEAVAWLCEDCEALPGQAWVFVDAVRGLAPEAVLLTTTAYADRVVQAPLVVPDPEPPVLPESERPRRPGTGRLLPTKSAEWPWGQHTVGALGDAAPRASPGSVSPVGTEVLERTGCRYPCRPVPWGHEPRWTARERAR